MSDVPELDQLIEESENVRRNKKWRRQDRFFKFFVSTTLFGFFLFFISLFVFGPETASVIICVFFLCGMLPFICETFFDMIGHLLKDDWEGRDMTKRYQRK